MLYAAPLALAPLMLFENRKFFLLCSIAHNRKNWLFSTSTKGAEASAAVYSLIETAKANKLDPYGYIEFILD